MNSYELFAVFPFILLAWLVWKNLEARELALQEAKRLCANERLMFLDDTVAMRRMRIHRGSNGSLHLRREFAFEYSDTGNNRRTGIVVTLGAAVIESRIDHLVIVDGSTVVH